MTENLVHEVQDADSSHCFLLSNHRNPGKPMNMVNIEGSSLGRGTIQLIKLRFSDWLWLESGPDAGSLLGVRAGGAEKRLSQRKEQCLCSMVPGSNYMIQMLWVCGNRGWRPMCGPSGMILKLCVCVCFLRRCFPLTQQKSPVNFPNTSHHHYTMSIYYLILSSAQPFLMFGSHSLSSREEGAEDSGPSS